MTVMCISLAKPVVIIFIHQIPLQIHLYMKQMKCNDIISSHFVCIIPKGRVNSWTGVNVLGVKSVRVEFTPISNPEPLLYNGSGHMGWKYRKSWVFCDLRSCVFILILREICARPLSFQEEWRSNFYWKQWINMRFFKPKAFKNVLWSESDTKGC